MRHVHWRFMSRRPEVEGEGGREMGGGGGGVREREGEGGRGREREEEGGTE